MKNIKIILYLLVMLLFTLTQSCWLDPPIEFGQPRPPCGVGSGDYYLSIDQYPSYTFDCNTDARLLVIATPKIDPSFQGFNRTRLILSNFYNSYESNWVNVTNSFNAQEFEIGGEIPAGTYYLALRMINYQPNSTCDYSIYTHDNVDFGSITVTACNSPSKTMIIENDWQGSDTVVLSSYNVFLYQDTSAFRMAFHAVDTKDSIIAGTFLVQQSIYYLEPLFTDIIQYITQHKEQTDRMYLCGVKQFVDAAGNPLPNLLGVTIVDNVNGFAGPPSEGTGSLVAAKSILVKTGVYAQNSQFLGVNYKQILESVVIHELGHQRAIIGHGGDNSEFCVMISGPILSKGSGYYNLYSNPHFCQNHMNILKGVQW